MPTTPLEDLGREDRLFARAIQPTLPELRAIASNECDFGPRIRARARLALQAIAERLERAASRDLLELAPEEPSE